MAMVEGGLQQAARRKRARLKEYVKRTERFMKWFAKIPRQHIDLNEVLSDLHGRWRLYARGATPCNSIGCVLGWGRVFLENVLHSSQTVDQYLGLHQFPENVDIFSSKKERGSTHRAEALNRLERRIKELRKYGEDSGRGSK